MKLRDGAHIAFIGNTLADRLQEEGWLETYIQYRFPEKNLSFRNLGFSADEVNLRQREEAFGSPDQWLSHVGADVMFAFFGFNESFRGEAGLATFKMEMADFIRHSKTQKYNGKHAPDLVLFSPIANEDLKTKHLPEGSENNVRIQMYTKVIQQVAEEEGVLYVDLFTPTRRLFNENKSGQFYTINGIHLNSKGNEALADLIDTALFGAEKSRQKDRIAAINAEVRDKNWHWFNRYRTTDGYNVYGGRSWLSWEGQTNRDVMLKEMEMFDVMTSNRDKLIWEMARAKEKYGEDGAIAPFLKLKADDSNLPQALPVKSYEKGAQTPRLEPYTYLSGEEAIRKMKVPDDLEINLFASEEEFPALINPMQIAFDADERLWAVTWPTYPHWNPRGELNDRILIFPDEDGDGKADKAITWVDGLNSITGFAFWNGGVVVAAPPVLYYMRDTNGDDKADVKIRLLDGLSSADSHHSANSLLIGPDGALYYQRGIFNRKALETPYGPFRSDRSGVYRFDPLTFEHTFHFPVGPNPHGDTFDQWGNQFAADGTGGRGYYVNIGKGEATHQLYEQKVRPVAGIGVLSSEHFPAKYNGNLMLLNVIGFQGIKRHDFKMQGADIQAVETGDLLVSSDINFRPTAAGVGGDGALYILDWQNALIGHMQHNMRDPGRDHKHGRIYRLKARNKPLLKPVKMAGKPLAEVISHLRSKQNGTRARVRIELTGRLTEAVLAEVDRFAAQLNPMKSEDQQPLLECLWIYQMHRVVNKDLLEKALKVRDARIRAAAVRVLGNWGPKVDGGIALLSGFAADPEPLVRAQVILASANFSGLAAADVMMTAASLPLDIQLEELIAFTRKKLDSFWQNALAEGKSLSKHGVGFVMKYGEPQDIARLPKLLLTSQRLLTHPDLTAPLAEEALKSLQKLTLKPRAQLLFEQLRGKEERSALLYALFLALPVQALQRYKPGMRALLIQPSIPGKTRVVAAHGLIKAGDQPVSIHKLVNGNPQALLAFIQAIGDQGEGEERDRFYTVVKEVLLKSKSEALSKLSIKTLLNMPGHEKDAFADLNRLLSEGKSEGAVIEALSTMDMKEWPGGKIKTLTADILGYLQTTAPLNRDQPAFKNGVALVTKLSARLSSSEKKQNLLMLEKMQIVEVAIKSVAEKMIFDVRDFQALAGQPVKITFTNPDAMPHNILVVNPGKADEIGAMAEAMPDGFAKDYIPKSKEIIAHTKLIKEKESAVIKFIAPDLPGDYPFICSFPGHSKMMRGAMKVQAIEVPEFDQYRVSYQGQDGPGKGKNIVFLASDHEYRGEETLPQMAKMLAKNYGFNCTVIFGLDSQKQILPGSSNVRGLEALDKADLLVIFTRFLNLSNLEMQYLDNYLERSGSVVGLRTATHAFSNLSNAAWQHYSYNYNGPKKEWKDGFGKYILGETWVSHYGTNHKQSSRITIDENQTNHPIFRGVKDMWVQSGGYTARPSGTVLASGEVLNGMTPDAPGDPKKQRMPVAWIRNYKLSSGAGGRVFATTHGASEDILNAGFRRMLINGCLWAMGMEDDIREGNTIDFVGPYQPTTFNFNGYKANVKPADLSGFDSLIMPGTIFTK